MGLEYYRDLLRAGVSDIARCSGGFNDRLFVAWSGYIYKFNWDELEQLLKQDDLQAFANLKKRLHQDLHSDIMAARQTLIDQNEEMGVAPWTDFQLDKYANAETVIRRWHASKAKRAVEAIVDMHNVTVLTVDFQKASSPQVAEQGIP